jgi:hypothetical protein
MEPLWSVWMTANSFLWAPLHFPYDCNFLSYGASLECLDDCKLFLMSSSSLSLWVHFLPYGASLGCLDDCKLFPVSSSSLFPLSSLSSLMEPLWGVWITVNSFLWAPLNFPCECTFLSYGDSLGCLDDCKLFLVSSSSLFPLSSLSSLMEPLWGVRMTVNSFSWAPLHFSLWVHCPLLWSLFGVFGWL